MATFFAGEDSGEIKSGDVIKELQTEAKMDWLEKFLPVEVATCPSP